MKQYREMINAIKERGVHKPAAREGMPGTTSLFGYQFRHNLADGFPALTTKKLYWKGVVIELLWFLSGDTNIKFLDQHSVRKMWHEDAYNYYVRLCEREKINTVSFEDFSNAVRNDVIDFQLPRNYHLGDCGMQYGKLWRNWPAHEIDWNEGSHAPTDVQPNYIDQIKELIEGLKNNPMGRRHILVAWNPATLDDMALNACHAMAQWNCRPLTLEQRKAFVVERDENTFLEGEDHHIDCDQLQVPKYYLDCQMYQRSADVFLGVPLNITSYALLTEILCKICNMVPGEMVYTYGDVHIYDNHKEQIEEQLSREERSLPALKVLDRHIIGDNRNIWELELDHILEIIKTIGWENVFELQNYNPHPTIKAKLSTGLK